MVSRSFPKKISRFLIALPRNFGLMENKKKTKKVAKKKKAKKCKKC